MNANKLAETARGQVWLDQFDPDDRTAAVSLLSCLRCVSASEFDNEIYHLCDAAALGNEKRLAMYAVREPVAGEDYFLDHRRRAVSINPGQPAGSEAAAAGRITQLARAPNSRFLDHPPIGSLKRNRVRDVVVIDDLVGSGRRVSLFLKWMLADKTLKSWRSYGLVRFHVVSYAATDEGMQFVLDSLRGNRANAGVSFLHSERLITGRALLEGADLKIVRDLCKSYAKRHKIKWQYWLGYRDTLSTLVFAHGCPNNTPGILWSQTGSWTPLFPNRTIPQDIRATFDHLATKRLQADQLRALGSPTIAGHRWFRQGSDLDRQLLLVLVALRAGARTRSRICRMTDLSRKTVYETVRKATEMGLIDRQGQLTASGLHGLRVAEEKRIEQQDLRVQELYYPHVLRGGHSSI